MADPQGRCAILASFRTHLLTSKRNAGGEKCLRMCTQRRSVVGHLRQVNLTLPVKTRDWRRSGNADDESRMAAPHDKDLVGAALVNSEICLSIFSLKGSAIATLLNRACHGVCSRLLGPSYKPVVVHDYQDVMSARCS